MAGPIFRGLLTGAGGGGGGGGGTIWDDEFDTGSVLDITGSRFAGANPWTKFNNTINFVRADVSGGQLTIETSSNGIFFDPRGGYQTLPSGDWAFETQCSMVAGSFEEGVGLFVGDSTDGLWLRFGNNFGDLAAVKRTGSVTATRATASIAAPYSGKLEIGRVGSTLTFKYDTGGGWTTLYTVTQTTEFAVAPTLVGIFVANKVSGTDNTGVFDWFRRTA